MWTAISAASRIIFLFALIVCDGSILISGLPIPATLMMKLWNVTHPSDEPSRPPTLAGTDESSKGVVVIQGIFDPAGDKLLELKPVRRFSWHSGPTPNQKAGRFIVKVIYVTGQSVTVPFDALVADDAGRTSHGFFEVVVPIRGEIASILITDSRGLKTFARINSSEIQP